MAISFPLDLPVHTGIRNTRISPAIPVARTQSEFTGAQQIQQHPGEWWEAELTLPIMTLAQAELWNVFFLKLRGGLGTFLIGDPARAVAQGSASVTPGTPLLNGAHAARVNIINLKGCPINVTGYLKAGDYIQLGTGATARLHKVLMDVNTNGSGVASNIDIFPFLRTSYSDGAAVVVSSAKGNFRLANNNVAWDIDEATLYQKSFNIVEAL